MQSLYVQTTYSSSTTGRHSTHVLAVALSASSHKTITRPHCRTSAVVIAELIVKPRAVSRKNSQDFADRVEPQKNLSDLDLVTMVRITDLSTELLLEICRHLADELIEKGDTSIYNVIKSCPLLHIPAFEIYFKLLPPTIQAMRFAEKLACLRIFKDHDERRKEALAKAVDRMPGWYIREHLMIKSIDYQDGKVVAAGAGFACEGRGLF